MNPEQLYESPNELAKHYTHFRVAERLLLTGHSHQAWPDCGLAAQQQAWLDAAEYVDGKWEKAFEKADEVRRGYAKLLAEPDADIALGQNTHELIIRFLSALPWRERSKLVSTTGEFHTIRRLLDRLDEEGIEIVKVPADPVDALADRMSEQIDECTAAVLVSSVLFQNAQIVPGLPRLAEVCAQHGAELLIDSYHHLNVVPFSMAGLENAYVVGGGYKYCQLGEGNCFLRLPKDCDLRPITSGWFSEFDGLTERNEPGKVIYGQRGNRFAGSTYDPTSHYRASSVFAFFEEQGLTPELLREISRHQVQLLAERFDALDLDPSLISRDRTVPWDRIAGFLVLCSEHAGEICARLREQGVMTDYRGRALRIGPAPYHSDTQLAEAMDILGRVCKAHDWSH